MRSHELDVGPADGRHADKVIGSCEKTRKGGDEGNLPLAGKPDRCAHHVLLGDKVFEESLGKLLAEPVGEGRIFHIRIQSDHARIHFAEFRQGGSEGFSSGHGIFR